MKPGRGLALVLPAVAGAVTLLVVTRRGAYVSPDALAYVGTARNLVGGNGYTSPPGSPEVGNFPPLFTLLLAGVGAVGPDPLTVARVANPLLFGATILLTGLVVRRLTGSLRLAFAAQLLVLAGIDFLAYHSSALSEPLFVLLTLLSFAGVTACLPRRRPFVLVGAALAAGAAVLTRYVGLAVILAGAAALLAGAERRRRWWAEPIAFAAVAAAPLFGWLAWLSADQGRATNRVSVAHPPDLDYATTGARNASLWFVPDEVTWPARGLVAAVLAVLLLGAAWRSRRPPPAEHRGAIVFGLFALAYLSALVGDRWLYDVTGRLDARFLMPLHAAAIVLAAWALRGTDLARNHVARIGVSAVVGLQLVSGGVWVQDALTDASVRPGGFLAPAWRSSPLLDEVRATGPLTTIYTNQVDALWFHTGRGARPIPEKQTFLTGEPNVTYGAEIVAMADTLRAGGLLVYFTAVPARRVFLPTPAELAETLQLQVVNRDEIGVAYRLGARPPLPPP
jgi:hypothetical protein